MKFVVSAPGKLILFGEHAVVYNYPAIAAAIGLRCQVEIVKESQSNSELILNFKDMGVVYVPINLLIDTDMDSLSRAWNIVSNMYNISDKEILTKSQTALGTYVFLFLLFQISNLKSIFILDFIGQNEKIVLNVLSDIPYGAGLGSSSAFCVAMTTAILMLTTTVNQGIHSFHLNQKTRDLIVSLSKQAESIIHGCSSGLDPMISTQGGIILYQKNQTPIFQSLPLIGFENRENLYKILLVHSGVSRSTKQAVRFVSDRLNSDDKFKVRAILENIGSIVHKALECILTNKFDFTSSFGTLIDENHASLVQLGVSNTAIDDIIELFHKQNLPAKLTGAGFGGCLFGLLVTNSGQSADKEIESIEDNLRRRSLWFKTVSLFVHGVTIESYEE